MEIPINIATTNDIFNIFNVVRIFVVATLTFFITLFVTPLWLKIISKYKLGKQVRKEGSPIFYNLHKQKEGTPTMGGILIWGTVVFVTVLFNIFAQTADGFWSRVDFLSRAQTLLPFGALIVAAIFGLIDDVLGIFKIGPRGGGLSMRYRILLYTFVAIGGAWWFYTKLEFSSINVPFLGDFVINFWYIPVFILILVATSFSANETDGLDGLVGGVFLTMFAAYAAIAFVQGRMDLAVFIAAIMGSLLAFLWYNIYPARLFMGDTGSMSLGVVIGIIAMLTNTPFLLIPIGIVFVIESGSVILQILSKKIYGKKLFLSTPIHHHFEAKNWPESQVTMRFWMISAVGAIIGLIIFLADSKLPAFFR